MSLETITRAPSGAPMMTRAFGNSRDHPPISEGNSSDLNPIEQMWVMGKGPINREQCNTPEELSV
jgi:hypothetical protein